MDTAQPSSSSRSRSSEEKSLSGDIEAKNFNDLDYDRDIIEFEEKRDLKRGLRQRHIQMIALTGTIGTGLFLGSGRAIANGGPLGAVLGYLIIGIFVLGPVNSAAELAALVPLSGGIVRQAEYFFDPALAFAKGYNAVYSHMMSLPAEIIAAAVIVEFWTTAVNSAVWITIFGVLILFSNLFLVRVYGELEFTFGILKIILIIALILFGIIVAAGGGPDHQSIGFRYWHDPGLFATSFLGRSDALGRFLGFWTTLTNAAYSYSNIETISIPASETHAPRRNIPKATKRLFWRIVIFYVIAIFVVTLLVPSNDPSLLSPSGQGAAQSPFVIAGTRAGVQVFPHFVNAIVLTSAWSAGNTQMLHGSRFLYALAREGHAPRLFLRVNRWGIPYLTVIYFGVFMGLAYMTLSATASTVFTWFQDIVTVAAFFNWLIICVVYLRFYYAMKQQGISRDELPWKSPFQPYLTWMSLIAFTIILLFNGYSTFMKGHWDTETFISSYFNIVFVFGLYFGYKFVKKTKLVPLDEMPIRKYIDIANKNPEPPERPITGWRRLNVLWN
ncbi:hypothetical protein GYMLUDRAFT_56839 [Collybiopsis luxurians FD-317 M1]|nr:hypothetical protein GYMLUDRAFT_56839 [Collybiopsis luxurians FD-317 M1]